MFVRKVGRKTIKQMLLDIETKPVFQKERPYVNSDVAKNRKEFICTINQLQQLNIPKPFFRVKFNQTTGMLSMEVFEFGQD